MINCIKSLPQSTKEELPDEVYISTVEANKWIKSTTFSYDIIKPFQFFWEFLDWINEYKSFLFLPGTIDYSESSHFSCWIIPTIKEFNGYVYFCLIYILISLEYHFTKVQWYN